MSKRTKLPDPFYITIGWNIRTARMQAGLSMKDLAQRINLSHNQINKYEKGHDKINTQRLHQISEMLDVPIDYFFKSLSSDNIAKYEPKILEIAAEIARTPSTDLRDCLYTLVRTLNTEFENFTHKSV